MVEPTMPHSTAGSSPCARAPVGGQRVEDFRVLAARLGRARALAHIERLAVGVAEREPQIAGAPVTGDERGGELLMACTCRR